MGEEKRKAIRIKTTLFVQYCFDANSDTKRWDISTVKDISESGVCLLTGKEFQPNEIIGLRFKVPSRPFETIEVAGRTIASTDTGTHITFLTRIEFKDLSEETKRLFHEYVDWIIKTERAK